MERKSLSGGFVGTESSWSLWGPVVWCGDRVPGGGAKQSTLHYIDLSKSLNKRQWKEEINILGHKMDLIVLLLHTFKTLLSNEQSAGCYTWAELWERKTTHHITNNVTDHIKILVCWNVLHPGQWTLLIGQERTLRNATKAWSVREVFSPPPAHTCVQTVSATASPLLRCLFS